MINRMVHRVLKPGSINRLTLREEELPELEPREVSIKVRSVGLNFADIFAVKGLYSATPKGGFIPGLEFAGDILDPGDSDFKAGQRVMGVTKFGAYADHLNIDKRYISLLPDDWSYSEGAAFQVQVFTAYYALVPLGNLQKDDKVLIHSAAGGVGIWANRIAKKKGAYTIGTVGSESKFDVLEREKYDRYLTRGKDFKESYLKEIGKEVRPNLVLECIGGKVLMDSYKQMERMGRLITYGSAHFASPTNGVNYFSLLLKYLKRPKFDPLKMTKSNKSVMGFNLIWLFDKAYLYRQYLDEIIALDLDRPIVGHPYPFEKAKEALTFFQTGKTVGKVVLEVE
jgi:alcohol dehydrogenase